MAHNINYNEQTKKHSFFSVQKKAWHGLGQIVENYPTSTEALQYAGLDFTVIKRPNRHVLENGKSIMSYNSSFFTYRTDTEDILGDKLGPDYQVVQNTEAFAFFDAIMEGEGIMYETAGALGKGERVFITAKLPDYIKVGRDDLIEKYLFLTTSHDGYGSITAAFTPTRIVCNNTLNIALSNCTNTVKIRHTTNAQERLKEAHRVMGISNKLTEELNEIFNFWTKVRITDTEVKKLIQLAMVPSKEVLQNIQDGKDDELSTCFKNICDNAFEYGMVNPSQQLDTTKGTLFGAYFLICPNCGNMLTGSASKGRYQYYYYYHCQPGCKCRYKADEANDLFVQHLKQYNLQPDVADAIKMVIADIYNSQGGYLKENKKNLLSEINQQSSRLSKARELLLSGDIEPGDYRIIKCECESKINDLEVKLASIPQKQERIEVLLDKAFDKICNLDNLYANATLAEKRQIVGSMYPEKLTFFENSYRTTRLNEAVKLIYTLGKGFNDNNKGKSGNNSTLSFQVGEARIEPHFAPGITTPGCNLLQMAATYPQTYLF